MLHGACCSNCSVVLWFVYLVRLPLGREDALVGGLFESVVDAVGPLLGGHALPEEHRDQDDGREHQEVRDEALTDVEKVPPQESALKTVLYAVGRVLFKGFFTGYRVEVRLSTVSIKAVNPDSG